MNEQLFRKPDSYERITKQLNLCLYSALTVVLPAVRGFKSASLGLPPEPFFPDLGATIGGIFMGYSEGKSLEGRASISARSDYEISWKRRKRQALVEVIYGLSGPAVGWLSYQFGHIAGIYIQQNNLFH